MKVRSWQFLPRHPARTSSRIGLGCLDRGADALGVALDLEGLLVPELNVAITLPPAAGRALLFGQSHSLHSVTPY